MLKEKMWRLTRLNDNETIALFTTHDDAKRFVARKSLEEYELHPCWCELSAIKDSGLDEKFVEPEKKQSEG